MAEPIGPFTDYLRRIGVPDLPPVTTPFDPGVAPLVVENHLEQSAHLMKSLKISMSCWIIADQAATRRKLNAARSFGVPAVAGGGPYEIAVARNQFAAYVELCADVGFSAIECAEGFTRPVVSPAEIVSVAAKHGLGVQFELGDKHDGAFDRATVRRLIDHGKRWLDAGAGQLVVEARESAVEIGLFDSAGHLNTDLAERLVDALGISTLVFEAPDKPSQFALLDHFGQAVQLGNVRLDELLRVEIYRRGLHSDSFSNERLRPSSPSAEPVGL